MRSVLALAAFAALPWTTPVPAEAQTEVITGFHGYPWGTPVAAIPEIAESQQVGEKDGMPIYSASVALHGKSALAGFYFHPTTGALIEGAYVFALTLQDCHPVWATLVEEIEANHPTLRREARIPARTLEDRRVYDTDCEFYVFNSHIESWTATYANPDPPHDRILLWMRTVERVPRLTVVYRGAAGQVWADRPKPPEPGPEGEQGEG
jgi:hypothetical protein